MQSTFNSIIELVSYFNSDEKCVEAIEKWRWNGTPECPKCGCLNHYKFKSTGAAKGRYKCADCYYQYTATTGTIFHSRKIPLIKWFSAIFFNSISSKGISSYHLAKSISVTQKTSWFMLTKLREAYKQTNIVPLEGVVMIDETFVGGKNKNRHIDKKFKYEKGRDFPDKVTVLGLVEMDGDARLFAISKTSKEVMLPIIYENVKKESSIVTDEWKAYRKLKKDYDHQKVDHSKKEFMNDCGFSTNHVEGLWSIVKRTYIGTYHKMSKKHIQRYMDEIAFRYNSRSMTGEERLNSIMSKISFKLTQKQITDEKEIPDALIAPPERVRRSYTKSGKHQGVYEKYYKGKSGKRGQ